MANDKSKGPIISISTFGTFLALGARDDRKATYNILVEILSGPICECFVTLWSVAAAAAVPVSPGSGIKCQA